MDELLESGIQISDALEAAHARGIIHRDTKPDNIFIVGAGRVKILDFGLAKLGSVATAETQTIGESITQHGAIVGTPSYMSPEQARGEELDARSDLFSLGVLLYEMATAHHPFDRRNRTLTTEAILHARPPHASSLNAALPAALDTIITKALEKDRELRWQRAADICSDLRELKRGEESGQSATSALSRKIRRFALAACLGTIAIAAGLFFYFHRTPALTAKDTIVLADFQNTTGDPVFDGTLRQGLAVALGQSPLPQPDLRRAYPANPRANETTARLPPDRRSRSRNL